MDPPLRFFTSPPTSHILSSTSLSIKSASEHLSDFLNAAETNPRNHPSHQLTPRGITFPQSAQNTSGTDKLRVLGFIARGMAGEVVLEAKDVMVEMGEKIRKERDEGEFVKQRPTQEERKSKKQKMDFEVEGLAEVEVPVMEEESQVLPRETFDDDEEEGEKAEQVNDVEELNEEQRRQRRREEKKARRKEEKKEKSKKRKDKST